MYSIYRLTLSSPGAIDQHYVGCTSNAPHRHSEHLSKLRKGKHPNKDLLAAFLSGAEVSFVVLDTALDLASGELLETNWTAILRCKGDIVFNRRHDAGSNAGLVHSPITKAKISASLAGRNTRSPEAIQRSREKLRGKKKPANVVAASQAALKLWRENPANMVAAVRKRCALTDEQVVAIRCSQKTYATIAEEFSTHASIVCKIKQGKSYSWVP